MTAPPDAGPTIVGAAPVTNIEVQRLPGIGVRYELSTGSGDHVVVVERRDGRGLLGVRRADADHLDHVIELDRDEATALGAALIRTRFTAAGEDQRCTEARTRRTHHAIRSHDS